MELSVIQEAEIVISSENVAKSKDPKDLINWMNKNIKTGESVKRQLVAYITLNITEEICHIKEELGTSNPDEIAKMIKDGAISPDSYNNFRVDCNLIALNLKTLNAFASDYKSAFSNEYIEKINKLASMCYG